MECLQVFHCVHFECPAPIEDKSSKSSQQEGQTSTSSDDNNSLPPPQPPPPHEVATEAVHIDSDES